MNGHVDENGRSLISVSIAVTPDSQLQPFQVWIDTGCTAEAVANNSFPLLGVGLFLGHTLNIDYSSLTRSVE